MEPSNAWGLLLCDDLIFSSKITATAQAHGLRVTVARTLEAFEACLAEQPTAVILELDHSPFDVAALIAKMSPRPRIIAYGSHVNVERLKAARAAGCDAVMPRSQFVEKLETELPTWLKSSSPG